MDTQQQPPATAKLTREGKWFSILGAVLCGMLVLAMLIAVIVFAYSPGGPGGLGAGRAIVFGTVYVFWIPSTFLPICLICLIGGSSSWRAYRQQASSDARKSFRLSWLAPCVVLVCYAAGIATASLLEYLGW